MAICVFVNARAAGNTFRILKSCITFIDPIFEQPVYRFPQRAEIFDFTVSGFELQWGPQLYLANCEWLWTEQCLMQTSSLTYSHTRNLEMSSHRKI